jgi:biotin carboxyl carrier protein
MKKVSIEINGQIHEGTVANSRGTLWVHLNGETFTYSPPGRQNRRGGARGAAAQPGEIVAPMPGKIVKILVQKGDDVVAGQVLLVMEAMKMEYTLKAQADGKVEAVACAPGDQVALGQNLAKLSVA